MATSVAKDQATFVDYFAIAGYDRDVGLVADRASADAFPEQVSLDSKPPLQRSYLAKILHHFPQKRNDAVFSEDILSLCLPRGLRFYTEKDVPRGATVHTFANIKEDGSRINGTALIYYEAVQDAELCEAMSSLHMEHVREITARERTGHERAHVPPGIVSGGTHTLPRRKDRSKRVSYYDGGGHNTLYMSKCICLLTRLPFVVSTTSILKAFHHLITNCTEAVPLPLESYIFWLLNEVPLPSPGTTLKVPFLNTTIIVQRPSSSELPFFDDTISLLFDFLSPERFLRLFTCFLLEHQILLCSKAYDRLMLVAETLVTLSLPFRWQMAYVPILPCSQLKFVEAPVPYLMGWCYEDSVPEFLYQSNVCVLDLDSGRMEIPEDLPSFPGAKSLLQDFKSIIERYTRDDSATAPIVMRRSSVGKRAEEWSAKRMSRSFDCDDIDNAMRPSRADLQMLPLDSFLKNNSTLARVAEIARKAGVEVPLDNIEEELASKERFCNSPISRQYFKQAKFTNAIRECMLSRCFIPMLYSYEHFIVGGIGCPDRDSFEANRDSLVCFDKASFLSDQPDSHLPFLAAFLETQMFASFIDAKILSQWETPNEELLLFDSRISAMRDQLGLSMVRTPSDSAPAFVHTEELINKREETLHYVVSPPHELPGAIPMRCDGVLPELNACVLEGSNGLSPAPSPWKQRYPHMRQKTNESMPAARPLSTYGAASLIGDSPTVIAQQQYRFVDQLLKESKGKTKRLLVDKMGKEAVHLGHMDNSVTGIEENTLVASFCDLLERIFAHGLVKKQGKSALWSFLVQHHDLEKSCVTTRHTNSSMLSPDFTNPSWSGGGGGSSNERCPDAVDGSPRKRSQSRARSPEGPRLVLSPLPTHIAYDLKNVLRMTEIKTDIGYARAFVRLALERKLLHKHLSTLLSNVALVKELYKPYSFTSCEDEKEQFLYHILSLNAAQFRCFTNTFTKTKISYQVVVVTGSWRGTLPAFWIVIEGTLCRSPQVNLAANTPLFKLDVKNLGVLSTLQIGQSPNAEKSAKWFLDYVLVRNEITGQTYRFPCGRYFGKGVDDGSLERLLVAETVEEELTEAMVGSPSHSRRRATSRSQTPLRERSPSVGRSETGTLPRGSGKTRITEIQHLLGESVNLLVKYFYSEKRAKSELAHLLCGERGLIFAIEQAFQFGRKDVWAARIFRQQYPWDYIEKVSVWFFELFRRGQSDRLSRGQKDLISYSIKLVKKISDKSALGKDGKFHAFLLLSLRDHVLSGYLQLMAWTPVTGEMYDEVSFFRTPSFLNYFSRLLDSLNEFQLVLDQSLTYGIS